MIAFEQFCSNRKAFTLGAFWFRKLCVGFRHFRVFAFCHRAYSKTRKPRKIFSSSVFEVLSLIICFEHFAKHFACSRQNSQGVTQSYQGALTIEAWNWLFLLLKLLSTIFYQIFIFHQMIALQKNYKKCFLFQSKKLFLFLRYLNFCIFVFPSFFLCQPLL